MSYIRVRPVATLQNVADAANVHRSTASRALRPTTARSISEPVIARVVAAAARLGYRRDLLAAGLRTDRSRLVGVFVPDICNPVFVQVLAGIETALKNAGYATLVANANHGDVAAIGLINELSGRGADGVILATTRLDDPVLARCLKLGLHAVLVYRADPQRRLSTVTPDEEAGLSLAVHHLADLGHRAIGHLAGPSCVSTGVLRASGFQAAMGGLGLAQGPHVEAAAYTRAAGRDAACILLERYPELTAIVAANDLLALGAYRALQERGLRCPVDISVVGYNDIPLMDMVDPPLTTIRIQHDLAGREAVRLLLGRMTARQRDCPTTPELILIPPSLIIRGSTAARHPYR